MQLNRRFIKNKEKAVSVVIGVILMVAVTVVVASTIYIYMSGMGGETSRTSTLLMNIFDRDTSAYQVVWMVSRVGGETVADDEYEWNLLDTSGVNATGAILSFNDNNNDNYVNSGDTFAVNTTSSASYVFTISGKGTGSLLFKSASTKY